MKSSLAELLTWFKFWVLFVWGYCFAHMWSCGLKCEEKHSRGCSSSTDAEYFFVEMAVEAVHREKHISPWNMTKTQSLRSPWSFLCQLKVSACSTDCLAWAWGLNCITFKSFQQQKTFKLKKAQVHLYERCNNEDVIDFLVYECRHFAYCCCC